MRKLKAATPNPNARQAREGKPPKHNRIRITPAKVRRNTAVPQPSAPPRWVNRDPPRATPVSGAGHPASRAGPSCLTPDGLSPCQMNRSSAPCFPRLTQVEKHDNIFSTRGNAARWPTSRSEHGRLQIGTGGRLHLAMHGRFVGNPHF